jgi:hypothetical protein
MAINLTDPTAQTWVFPAAAATQAYSSSIYIPGYLELIGYEVDKAAEATTDHYEAACSLDGTQNPNLADADLSDFVEAVHIAGPGGAEEWPASTAGAVFVWFERSEIMPGPMRVRLLASTAAHADVDQDGQIVTPIFRDTRRG